VLQINLSDLQIHEDVLDGLVLGVNHALSFVAVARLSRLPV
jgi:hypothetical protein